MAAKHVTLGPLATVRGKAAPASPPPFTGEGQGGGMQKDRACVPPPPHPSPASGGGSRPRKRRGTESERTEFAALICSKIAISRAPLHTLAPMPLPLSGLLVVSLEQAVAAPMCTCRLADAGARVIKVERPEGDFARYYDKLAVPRSRRGSAEDQSAYFVWLNRGKESVVLDLARADDKALLSAMLAKADVFVQNLKPGAVA